MLAFVVILVAGMPMQASFAGNAEVDDDGLEKAVSGGNRVAVRLNPEEGRLQLSPDILRARGEPVEAVSMGQANLRVARGNEHFPMESPFFPDVPLYANPSSNDTSPRIARNPIDGHLWAAFSHFNGADEDVYVSYSSNNGQTWNVALSTVGSYNETNPAIAIAGNTIMIAYEQDGVGHEQHTFILRSQDGGMNWYDFYINWNWTNADPNNVNLTDFNDPDISAVRPEWFHWTASAWGPNDNTRTVAFMWTDNDGDTWFMVYWTPVWHIGEDFEHPVIMENSADNYVHNAFQWWNSTTGDYDISWMYLDHGLMDLGGYWTAALDGGNSEIAPDLWVRDDYVFLAWQNGTSSANLTAFYSDDGGMSSPWLVFVTETPEWDEIAPSCFVDQSYSLHVAFSNESVVHYGTTASPTTLPFDFKVVSETSVTPIQQRLLDLILIVDAPAVAWTDLRNGNPDIYFSSSITVIQPIAIAKPVYQEVYVGQVAWLFGNESYDPDGSIVNYSWLVEGPPGDIYIYGDIVSFTPTQEGGYLVTLTVRDNMGLEDTDLAFVNATNAPPNFPPVAVAGDDQIVFMWENVTFDGSGSYDPDGVVISYFWDFDDGASSPGQVVTHVYNRTGVFHVVLAVVDDYFAMDTDRMVVVVLDPSPDPPKGDSMDESGGDLVLRWQLSADDGDDFDDVLNYAIYFSSVYDPDGNGYEFLAEVPAGTDFFVHVGAGEGDWNTYFYYIQANDSDGYARWEGQLVKFVRHLTAGMHMLSIPAILDDYDVRSVLQPINGSYEYVRGYDPSQGAWKTFWAHKSYGELTEMDIGAAYWIRMTQEDHLLVLGTVPDVVEVALSAGWNLVSCPSFIDVTVEEALSAIGWRAVEGYSDAPPHNLRRLNPTDVMTAGDGYWILVDLPQVMTVHN